ncbi:MAG: cytochrome c oxidase subunit II [Ktedonobacteraceae bacterium]|nr:cytochrome c oxidase subunit II [Ktedonobacteraceae bacterium]
MPRIRGMNRWGLVLSTLILSSLLFAACGGTPPSTLNPAGPVANEESILFWFILIVATLVFVIVEGILIWSIIRYRERPNMPTPRQTHGNTKLEIWWTIAPSIFLFAVLVFTIRTMFVLADPPAGSRTLQITAVGHQWWWEFDYANQKITTADDLYVPVGTAVEVQLKSNNVIHSFWIPELTGKTDVVPGHTNSKWFQGDRVGVYRGECAEFCGAQHAHMAFNVHVLSNNDFLTWVSGQQQDQATTANTPGGKLFKSLGCTACHGIVGINLSSFQDPKATALIGPNLTHFGGRDLIAGGVLENTPANLTKWLQDPQGVKPGNDMVIGQLTPAQINTLVDYLENLK